MGNAWAHSEPLLLLLACRGRFGTSNHISLLVEAASDQWLCLIMARIDGIVSVTCQQVQAPEAVPPSQVVVRRQPLDVLEAL